MKCLFDTNVVIDALTSRYENSIYSQQLLKEIVNGKINGFLSCKQITDISFILRKYFDKNTIREIISYLLVIFELLPILPSDIKVANSLEMNNFEDAVIYETSKVNMISCIVTNSIKDFESAKINIMMPKEVIAILNNH